MKHIGRPSTQKAYDSLYRKWILPYIQENWEPDDIVNSLLQETKELSPNTQKIIFRLLKRHFEEKGIDTSLVKKASIYISRNNQQKKVKALTNVQSHEIMKVCKKEYKDFYPVMMFGLHAGLRRGEVFGLQWEDIDFIKGQFIVQRSYSGPTKNGKSRIIPISKELEKALMGIYLVGNKNKNIFKAFNPNPTLEIICRKAKVPIISFHGLRHTFATLALESGMSPKQVQEILGHSTLTTTLNIYWSNISEKPNLDFLPGL